MKINMLVYGSIEIVELNFWKSTLKRVEFALFVLAVYQLSGGST